MMLENLGSRFTVASLGAGFGCTVRFAFVQLSRRLPGHRCEARLPVRIASSPASCVVTFVLF